MVSLVISIKCLMEKLAQSFKTSSKVRGEGNIPNSFHEATITLLFKQDKDITRKLQTNVTYNYRQKNSYHILANQN